MTAVPWDRDYDDSGQVPAPEPLTEAQEAMLMSLDWLIGECDREIERLQTEKAGVK